MLSSSRKMTAIREWSLYFKVLTYSGVLPVSLSKNNREVSTLGNKRCCLASFCCQNLFQSLVLYLTVTDLVHYMDVQKTYKDMQVFQLSAVCITHFLIHTWIFSQKTEIFKILSLVITKSTEVRDIAGKNFRFLRNLNIFYHVNGALIEGIISFMVSEFHLNNILFLVSVSLNFVLSTLVLSFLSTLVEVIEDVLRKSNQRLEVIVFYLETNNKSYRRYFFELMDILKTRNDLLLLCSSNISRCFGIPIIFISMFVLITVAHVPMFFAWSMNLKDSFAWIPFLLATEISTYMIVPKILIFRKVFSFNLRIQVRFLTPLFS